ncbi:hypothetical protein Tco_0341272 [Tanacetum coccineum]
MNEKMKDPICVKKKVKIIPPEYLKENYLATSTPQKQLTPEQIFWSDDILKEKAKALKERANDPKQIIAVTVYPPNTPVKLVPMGIVWWGGWVGGVAGGSWWAGGMVDAGLGGCVVYDMMGMVMVCVCEEVPDVSLVVVGLAWTGYVCGRASGVACGRVEEERGHTGVEVPSVGGWALLWRDVERAGMRLGFMYGLGWWFGVVVVGRVVVVGGCGGEEGGTRLMVVGRVSGGGGGCRGVRKL